MDVLEKTELRLGYTLSPPDSRVRVGLVVLSSDHSLEMEWAKVLSNQAMMFVNRLPYCGSLYPDSLGAIELEIATAAKYIATGLELDVLAFACTSSSAVIGNQRVAELLNMHRNKPLLATNPLQAMFAALDYLQAKSVAVFSPYPTSVNRVLDEQFDKHGFHISSLGALHIDNDVTVPHISKQSIFDGIEAMLDTNPADAVFLSCTNLRVFDFIEELEAKFKLPVVTSNQALYWHALHLKGVNPCVKGYGSLLNSTIF